MTVDMARWYLVDKGSDGDSTLIDNLLFGDLP